ncbi:hypothetical protein SAMN05192541_12882 [Bradyrhizobium arachidis]|nr:hypothetical protein SAMN05192541_12882 [Bradyrhizobium arachidis]
MTAEHCGHRCANMLGMASLLGTGLKKPESHFFQTYPIQLH